MSCDCEMCRAVSRIAVALAAADDGRALDEAFIWEPPLERRPLVTFGEARRLVRQVRAIGGAGFDAAVANLRAAQR